VVELGEAVSVEVVWVKGSVEMSVEAWAEGSAEMSVAAWAEVSVVAWAAVLVE
jgi:hypothetical protein